MKVFPVAKICEAEGEMTTDTIAVYIHTMAICLLFSVPQSVEDKQL